MVTSFQVSSHSEKPFLLEDQQLGPAAEPIQHLSSPVFPSQRPSTHNPEVAPSFLLRRAKRVSGLYPALLLRHTADSDALGTP